MILFVQENDNLRLMGLGTTWASFSFIWINILCIVQKFVIVAMIVIGVVFDDFIMV